MINNAINNSRLDAIDLAKGALMVLMALDHASALVGHLHWSEFWGTALPDYAGNTALFLTRFVTHPCAPGFFFFMGIGIVLMAQRATAGGMSTARIHRHFLVRGALLVLFQQFIENPAWLLGFIAVEPGDWRGNFNAPGDESQVYLHFGVLTALGVALMIGGLLHRMRAGALLLLAAILLGFSQWQTPDASAFKAVFPYWQQLLLVAGHGRHVNVLYPLVPWLGICCLGIAFGKKLLQDPQKVLRWSTWLGLASVMLFVGLRLSPAADSARVVTTGLIGFLSVTKYPPSIEFVVLTLGLNLLALGWWQYLSLSARPLVSAALVPLRLFGRTALFFYLVHLYIYALMGHLFPPKIPLSQIYAAWILGITGLFFICRAYLKFKTTRGPNSLWRFF